MYSRKTIFLLLGLVCHVSLKSQPIQRFSVIIDEIMADPSPAIGLPNSEYIELRNRSPDAVDLSDWQLTDNRSTARIPAGTMLLPDSFLVICPLASAADFPGIPVIGVPNFPSLNNDGDTIILFTNSGQLIHSVAFGLDWYGNSVKQNGGWSLEMIDTDFPCRGGDNWVASIDAMGGSPGRSNSVNGAHPDRQPPLLLRTYTTDELHLVAVFNEPLDSLSAAKTDHYRLNLPTYFIASAEPTAPSYQEVRLRLTRPLTDYDLHLLSVENICDCSGNAMAGGQAAPVALPAFSDSANLVINELLFNPPADGADYVEIYNRGRRAVDASHLVLSSRDGNGNLRSGYPLAGNPYLLFPDSFLVVTTQPEWVSRQYWVTNPVSLLNIKTLPPLPDDKGSLVLLSRTGKLLDEIQYSHNWHFPLLTREEGVALERIDYSAATQDAANWASAAGSAGYGTPTCRNSQSRALTPATASVSIEPAVFSPDNDGHDDYAIIRYQFDEPGYVAAVFIFDASGRPVRRLVENETLAQSGLWRWNGLSDLLQPLPSGPYIVLVQVFSPTGKRKKFKHSLILARKF